MTIHLGQLTTHWLLIARLFSLHNDQEYDAAVALLNALVDEIGTNERHPLYGLLDTLGTIIHSYEAEHIDFPTSTGPEVLEYLMDEHDLSLGDLPELGTPDSVERYLTDQAELSIGQVRSLAQRFHVSAAAFI